MISSFFAGVLSSIFSKLRSLFARICSPLFLLPLFPHPFDQRSTNQLNLLIKVLALLQRHPADAGSLIKYPWRRI